MSEQLRIRPDNGTIRGLPRIFLKRDLEELQRIVSSHQATDADQKNNDKATCKASPCCVCGGIPTYEVVYDADGVQE